MEKGNKNLYQVSEESHARRPLLIALVVLILVALALIMWWQSASRERAPADLTEAERAEIQTFLSRTDLPVPTAGEAAAINEYLVAASSTLSESEKSQILDYLQ